MPNPTTAETWTNVYMEEAHRASFLEGIGAAVDYDAYTLYPKSALDEMYTHRKAVEDGAVNRTILAVSHWYADFTRDLLFNLMSLDGSSRDELIQRILAFVLPIAGAVLMFLMVFIAMTMA